MDESWRMRNGMPRPYQRRSIDLAALNRSQDFADVFGGPPRTVSGRKISGEFTIRTSFYEDIFQQPEIPAPAKKAGRCLQGFNIPARSDEFYGDVFGKDWNRRSRTSSKGKSSSSSSEELSPFRPVIGDDVALYSFSSQLRPLDVSTKWNSSTMMSAAFPYKSPSDSENQYMDSGYKSSYQGFSSQTVTSPEMTSCGPTSYQSMKLSEENLDFTSPPSDFSSFCQEWEDKTRFENENENENESLDDDRMQEHEIDEVRNSYLVEIHSDHYREGNDDAIDEAIAWAKEKFQQQSPKKDWNPRQGVENIFGQSEVSNFDEMCK